MNALVHHAAEYLLNSLWQTPLLLGVAWLAARALRRLGPAMEHRVWVGALLAQIILPACAAPWLGAALRHLFQATNGAEGAVTITFGAAKAHGDVAASFALRAALLLYGSVIAVLLLRIVWQWVRLQKLSRHAAPLMLGDGDALFVRECCTRFHVARVELATAAEVRTPLTFGLFRPVLMLPPGFAEEVSAAQLRTALGHELAHVARHDAAKHLVYRLLSVPVAYHPAVWVTLANLAETRERVCDGIAAEFTGDARRYAHTLLELATLLTARRPAQPHAIGLFDANQLERRVLMLNRRNFPIARSLRIALVAGSAVVATAICSTAVALHLNVATAAAVHANPQLKIAPGVAAGQIVSKVAPKYPEEAKKAKVQGSVVLNAIISKDGTVQNLQVASGPEELRAASLEAVKQWVYKPYLLNGDPVEVETTITVTFSLAG
ncbi:M56 family metallopeptidase [Terriglobus sp.]|uniref:M56 family metallopeptidase n=1 Tax=Terriglobus sp. TaxID=1889013 RepID=UPI003B00D4D1